MHQGTQAFQSAELERISAAAAERYASGTMNRLEAKKLQRLSLIGAYREGRSFSSAARISV